MIFVYSLSGETRSTLLDWLKLFPNQLMLIICQLSLMGTHSFSFGCCAQVILVKYLTDASKQTEDAFSIEVTSNGPTAASIVFLILIAGMGLIAVLLYK